MTYAPIHAQQFDTKEKAFEYAIKVSKFNDFFIYVFFVQDSGKWVADQSGEPYSNEILEGIFHQGELQPIIK